MFPQRVCALLAPCLLFFSATSLRAEPVALFSTERAFQIPFGIDAANWHRAGARAVQLLVSEDGGNTWSPRATAVPRAGAFRFNARTDGEYRFAIRPAIRSKTATPIKPELRVIVDTSPPVCALFAKATNPGEAEIRWSVNDPNLDRDSVAIEVLRAGAAEWQRLPIAEKTAGVTTYRDPAGGAITIRCKAADRAGLQSTTTREATIAPVPTAPLLPPPMTGPQIQPANRAEPAPVSEPPPIPLPPPPVEPAKKTVPQPLPEPVCHEPPHRLLNKTEFDVGYNVDDIGPSGVGKVELFITENDGRKWFRYGIDKDRRSPFRVKVPKDGKYGFWVRVHSGAGLADQPPRVDDEPQLYVSVDRAAPTAKWMHPSRRGNVLTLAWKVTDPHPATRPVFLAWSAAKDGPWEPISGWVENSGRFDWDLDAHKPVLPAKVFLRLTARDAAGNTTRVDLPAPVLLDLSRPKGRIIGAGVGP